LRRHCKPAIFDERCLVAEVLDVLSRCSTALCTAFLDRIGASGITHRSAPLEELSEFGSDLVPGHEAGV
jgi:hypothetical protein